MTKCDVHRTFNVCSDGVETGDLIGVGRVAPEDVVLWVDTDGRVGQILLLLSLESTKERGG
jgi:hypothetical protein